MEEHKKIGGNIYIHPKHGLLFVDDGISDGRAWGTFYRAKSGALRRFTSPALPMRDTPEEAQADLDAYARARGLEKGGGRDV